MKYQMQATLLSLSSLQMKVCHNGQEFNEMDNTCRVRS